MPSNTKTALLDSAERVARARGFDGFSYANLAQDVGIRKASIHHHFSTKAVLSAAVMQRYFTKIEAMCAEIDETHRAGAARLGAMIDCYRSGLEEGQSMCLCVSFSASRESLPADVLAQISRFRAMVLNWLSATFALGQNDGTIQSVSDPALDAAAALPLLEGAQLAARAEADPQIFDTALQLLKARLA